jgi:protein gp37
MADNTKIEWTDATWNPITGCQIVSDGCKNCYAMQLAGTRLAHTPSRTGLTRKNAAGKHIWTGETRFNRETLDQPLRWKRPRRIFVCAHGDLFAESVPTDWIDQVFAIMALAPQHTFQVLTKRPERMREYLAPYDARRANGLGQAVIDLGYDGPLEALSWPLPNVWLGVSVEDQATADARIPHLLATPAAIRWISAEPLLGPVDVRQMIYSTNTRACSLDALSGHFSPMPIEHLAHRSAYARVPDPIAALDWVVVGGESGPGARPMHPDWARSLRDQCAAAGVPYFFKQWGEWVPAFVRDLTHLDRITPKSFGANMERAGKARAGRTLDGITHDAWPEV